MLPVGQGVLRGREMDTLVEVPEGANTREWLLEGEVLVSTFLAAFHRDPPSVPHKDRNSASPGAFNTQLHRTDQYQGVCSQEIPTY